MKLGWDKVPFEVNCPKCQESTNQYENIEENQWKYLSSRNPDPLNDYHKCPLCKRMWAILKFHADEI